MDAGVSRLLAAVRATADLANYADTIKQHARSLESAIRSLGNELSYHSETLLQQVRLHDQELSRVTVSCQFYRRDAFQFILV